MVLLNLKKKLVNYTTTEEIYRTRRELFPLIKILYFSEVKQKVKAKFIFYGYIIKIIHATECLQVANTVV